MPPKKSSNATPKAPAPPTTTPQETPEPTPAPAPAPAKSLLSHLVKASDLVSMSRLKTLLYGPSGSGKTETGARFRRPLIGLTEMQAVPVIQEANPEAMIMTIKNKDDLNVFVRMLLDPEVHKMFDAVVLDSLTDCQRIIRWQYTRDQKSGRDVTDMDTWGLIIDATARLARVLRDVPLHVLCICLEEEENVHGSLVHRPSVNGKKLPNDLAQYFSLVGYIHKHELDSGVVRHEVMFNGSDRYLLKGMRALDAVEPPEPLWWAFKRFGGEPDRDVAERVSAWQLMEPAEEEPQNSTSSTEENNDKAEVTDPFK